MKYNRRDALRLIGAGIGSMAAAPLLTGCGDDSEPACELDFWLCGNHGPTAEIDAFDLEVEGTIPPSLRGTYLRNGPNPLSGTSNHWFSGDGMVHAVRLEDGAATWFRSRYVETQVMGQPPLMGPPNLSQHPANTSVLAHGGRLFALAEAGLPYELSPDDLNTLGPYDYGGSLNSAMTAHPKIDPVTGELVFFGAGIANPTIEYHEVDADGVLQRSVQLVVPSPILMHDFQITDTHAVFMDLPLVFDLDLARISDGMGYQWTPANGARIGVLPRGTGMASDVLWIDIEPCYVFHTFNAYTDPADPNRIVLDTVRYPQIWVRGPSDFEYPNQLTRYSIDVIAGTVSRETLYDRGIEFPRIDARKQGTIHRFGYSLEVPSDYVSGAEAIVKIDFQTGEVITHRLEAPLLSSELTFVPDSPTSGEDEGWLLSYAYDSSIDKSRLLIFDATNIAAGSVASVRLPGRVPYGFHGVFLPDAR